MNMQSFQKSLVAALAVLAVLPVLADDSAPAAAPAPAPAAADASGIDRSLARPGRSDRVMTPEMKEYIAKLDAIRLERDAQAIAAAKAEKDIEARKDALAEEKEDVKALVDKAAELRAELAETEKALEAIWDADEKIAQLRDARKAAESARAKKQFEMQSAVQAAMRARSTRLGNAPEIRSVEAAKAAVKDERTKIRIGGKSMEEFLAEHPTVVLTNGGGRPLVPPPARPAPARPAPARPAPASAPSAE